MEKNINRNIGLDTLRVIMCFGVILVHFWAPSQSGNSFSDFCIIQIQQLAVPVFMMISFIVLSKEDVGFISDNPNLKKRITRLLIPIIFWAVAYYFVLFIAEYFVEKDYDFSYLTFCYQIFVGHEYNKPMWFQNVLLYLTLIIFFVYKGNKHLQYPIAILCIAIPFTLQYTDYNHRLFDLVSDHLSIPLGRFVNMLPYAFAGILAMQLNILSSFKQHKFISLLLLSMVFVTVTYFVPGWHADSFGSNGIRLFIMVISLVSISYVNPPLFEGKKVSTYYRGLIGFLSKYTLGIYCVHNMIGAIYSQIIASRLGIDPQSLISCFIIFMISLTICFLLSFIPNKYIQKSIS